MTEVLVAGAAALVGLLAGALIVVTRHLRREQEEVRRLQARIWKRWLADARLRRALEIERAARVHALDTYRRRTDRWKRFAFDLQAFALQSGLLEQWKVDADRKTVPFVDSDVAPLGDAE